MVEKSEVKMNKDRLNKILTTIDWILIGTIIGILISWLIISIATYNAQKEIYEKPCNSGKYSMTINGELETVYLEALDTCKEKN